MNIQRKLLLFRCSCNKTSMPEVRVRKAGDYHHAYLYHRACGNVEFLFKAVYDVLDKKLRFLEYRSAAPIPSDFLRGGEGQDTPLLAEEYAEQAAKKFEIELDDIPDEGTPDP